MYELLLLLAIALAVLGVSALSQGAVVAGLVLIAAGFLVGPGLVTRLR